MSPKRHRTPSVAFALLVGSLLGCASRERVPDEPSAPRPAPDEVRIIIVPGEAREVPDAAAAAERVGDEVEMEDVIAAVSYAPRRRGYYLSFGAPYPKQVLSVFVPEDVYEGYPAYAGLLGRRVRLIGRVYRTRGGAEIELRSLDHFEVLPVDPVVLRERGPAGPIRRAHFAVAVQRLIVNGEIDALEALHQALLAPGDRFGVRLAAFHRAFFVPSRLLDVELAKRQELLARWANERPDSVLPVLGLARLHLNRAWAARGRELGSKVSQEQWEAFRDGLQAARRVLEDHPAARSSAEWFALMQTVALGQQWDRERYFALLDEALSHHRDYISLYYNVAEYLHPKWFGEPGDLEAFLEREMRRRGSPDGAMVYALVALGMQPMTDESRLPKTRDVWRHLMDGLLALAEQGENEGYYRSWYAYLAWKQADSERLPEAMDALGDDVEMEVWVNLENVAIARRMARSMRERREAQGRP